MVVAVEGYMDVIALHQAGFGGAVAPLGTALTEEQFAELWRLSPAPVLCFDGDAAGARAAARAAELALPLLAPERSLCLASLPAGEDPDTLVRRGGAADSGGAQAPPGRCATRSSTCCARRPAATGRSSARRCAPAWRRRPDASRTALWPRNIAGRCCDRFFAARRRGAAATRADRDPPPAAGRRSRRPADRCRVLLAILLRHPALLHDVEEALGTLDLPRRSLA